MIDSYRTEALFNMQQNQKLGRRRKKIPMFSISSVLEGHSFLKGMHRIGQGEKGLLKT